MQYLKLDNAVIRLLVKNNHFDHFKGQDVGRNIYIFFSETKSLHLKNAVKSSNQ